MRRFILLCGLLLSCFVLLESLFPIGIVGEVATAWVKPPTVIHQIDPIQSSALEEIGPLTLRSTRPILSVGQLPLSTNIYTSAIPDWPAALLFRLFQSSTIVLYWHALLCGLLLLSFFRLLRDHLSTPHRYLLLLLLGSDWMFLFYKP